MTNEELKKKIVEILDNNIRWQPYYYISRGIVYEDDLKNIAEALIEVDIGDVSEWKHRAARAERALYNACCEQNKHWCVQCDSFAECDTSNEMCIEAKKHAEELIKQAEKELAEEERKDG